MGDPMLPLQGAWVSPLVGEVLQAVRCGQQKREKKINFRSSLVTSRFNPLVRELRYCQQHAKKEK